MLETSSNKAKRRRRRHNLVVVEILQCFTVRRRLISLLFAAHKIQTRAHVSASDQLGINIE